MNGFQRARWNHISKKMAHEIGGDAWHEVMDDGGDYRIRPMEQLVVIYCNLVGKQSFIDKYFNENVLYMCSHQNLKRTIRRCDRSVQIFVDDVIIAEGRLNEKK